MKNRSRAKTSRKAAPGSPVAPLSSVMSGTTGFGLAICLACIMAAAAAPPAALPAQVRVRNITAHPQLTFFPAGTVMSVGAFARITARINIQDLVKSCNLGTNAMKPLFDLLPRHSHAFNFAKDDGDIRAQYNEHKHRLAQACKTLEKWDKPDNFFRVEPDQFGKRSFAATIDNFIAVSAASPSCPSGALQEHFQAQLRNLASAATAAFTQPAAPTVSSAPPAPIGYNVGHNALTFLKS